MTIYYPESDTLDCGCNPDWPDHRCRYGCSRCGAPDDCYCPSRSEILENAISTRLVYPVRLIITGYTRNAPGLPLHTVTWLCPARNDLIGTILDFDPDDNDMTIYDADGTEEKI